MTDTPDEPTVEILIDPLTEAGMDALCNRLGDLVAAEVIYHAARSELKKCLSPERRVFCEQIADTARLYLETVRHG